MPYEDKQALYGLNSYTWKVLESNLGYQKTSYGGRPNLIPANQEPEFLAYEKPFVVYGSMLQPSPGTHRTEHVAYTVYATTVSEVNKIVSLLTQVFERWDDSADDVNVWLRTEGSKRAGIKFGYIRVLLGEFAEPREEEGGWVSGQILLEARYTLHNSTIQTTGFTV